MNIYRKRNSSIIYVASTEGISVSITCYVKTTDPIVDPVYFSINDQSYEAVTTFIEKQKYYLLSIDFVQLGTVDLLDCVYVEINGKKIINILDEKWKNVRVEEPSVSYGILKSLIERLVKLEARVSDNRKSIISTISSSNGPPIHHNHEMNEVNELLDKLNSKADTTHTHELIDIDGLQEMLTIQEPAQHVHAITEIDSLSKTLDEFSKHNHQHDITDVAGLETIIDSKIKNNLDLNRVQLLESMIKKQLYMHVATIEIFDNPESSTDTHDKIVWIKLVTNLKYKPSRITDMKDRESKSDVLENETNELEIETNQVENETNQLENERNELEIETDALNLSKNIQLNTSTELNAEPYYLNIHHQINDLKFVKCIILPNGPKGVQDFPVGNTKFEWLESEIHIQYITSSDIESQLYNTSFQVSFKDVVMLSSQIKHYEKKDWFHYYLYYLSNS